MQCFLYYAGICGCLASNTCTDRPGRLRTCFPPNASIPYEPILFRLLLCSSQVHLGCLKPLFTRYDQQEPVRLLQGTHPVLLSLLILMIWKNTDRAWLLCCTQEVWVRFIYSCKFLFHTDSSWCGASEQVTHKLEYFYIDLNTFQERAFKKWH